jgi:hypothetical protein
MAIDRLYTKIVKLDDVEGAVYELDNWKPKQSTLVKHHFTEKFRELKEAYEGLVEDFNWNKIIYESEMLCEPIMGQTYHLYQRKNETRFVSLISAHEWGDMSKYDIDYIGSFRQDSRQKWNHIKLSEKYEEIDE